MLQIFNSMMQIYEKVNEGRVQVKHLTLAFTPLSIIVLLNNTSKHIFNGLDSGLYTFTYYWTVACLS